MLPPAHAEPPRGRRLLLLAAALSLAAALDLGGCAAPKRVLRPPAEPVAAPSGPQAPSDTAARRAGASAAELALQQVGTPYRLGGQAPGGFDCSGLVRWVYREHGLELPRTVREQVGSGSSVAADSLAPGDLLFFSLRGGPGADHVGIHVGEGAFVHAPGRGRLIRREWIDPFWRLKLVDCRRPWSESSP